MSISKLVDNRSYQPKTSENVCMKGSSDCMFLTSSGGCSAEWCIFNELPKITTGGNELTCSICGKNKKTVSPYSGITSFICDECSEKIKKITPKQKPCAVCGVNNVEVDQYICSDCQQKILKTIKDTKCAICGQPVNPGEYICSTCSTKIKEKLDE